MRVPFFRAVYVARCVGARRPLQGPHGHAGAIRSVGHRAQVAAALGVSRHLPQGPEEPQGQEVRARDAAVPIGEDAHGARAQLPARRRVRSVLPHEGLRRRSPHGVGRLRAPGGERGHQGRRAPGHSHPGEHRQLQGRNHLAGLRLRLVARGEYLGARVLPVEPVVLPQDAREGPGVPAVLEGELVHRLPHRHRQRAGEGRRAASAASRR